MGTWGSKDLQQAWLNADADGDNLVISLPADKPNGRVVIVGGFVTLTAAGVIIVQDTSNVLYFEIKDPGVSYAGTFDAPMLYGRAGKGVEISNPAGVDTNGALTYFID